MTAQQNDQQVLSLLADRLRLAGEQLTRARDVYNTCWRVLESDNKSASSLSVENGEDVWRPCIVWLIKSIPGVLDEQEDQPERASESPQAREPPAGLPLSELLSICSTNLVSFFKELPVVVNKLKPTLLELTGAPDNIEQQLRLREWQETLVSLQHISNKYKDLFYHVQRSSPVPKGQPLQRAGWLAFLLIKAQLLPGFPDLVSCLELLVCVLNLFVASNTYGRVQLDALLSGSPCAIEPSGKLNTLKMLSQEAKVDYSKAKVLMPQIEARFCSLLEDAQFPWLPNPLPTNSPHPQADKIETCCKVYLEGLTEKQEVADLVLSLDASYQKFYMEQGEIDERDFLVQDFTALASPRAMPGTATGLATAQAAATLPGSASGIAAAATAAARGPSAATNASSLLAGLVQQVTQGGSSLNPAKPPLAPGGLNRRPISLGLQSPLPLMQLGHPGPATPISQAMGSVAWLRSLARDLPLEPPPSLKRFMEAAGADAGRVLEERVQAAGAAVFMSETGSGSGAAVLPGQRPFPELQQGVAQERRDEGIKVYWHVLESMLKAEEARAGLPAACSLLTRWSFHQCLLACSFELVAASYRMGLLIFPAIPTKLGLKPFDLSKMIGPFVKAEPTLPRELKRHMFTVEEKILESLGWAPGSSFYRLTRAATGQQQPQPAAAVAAAAVADRGVKSEAAEENKDADMDEGTGAAAAAEAAAAAATAIGEQTDKLALPPVKQEGTQELQQRDSVTDDQPDHQGKQHSSDGSAAPSDRAAAGSSGSRKRGMGQEDASEPMDTDSTVEAAAAAAAAGATKRHTTVDVVPKRQRGEHGGVNSHPHAHENFTPLEPELPLPRALGTPNSAAAAGADPSARAVLYDYCRKVLKLAAFRLVAISDGLDFSPMERDDVIAAVHEVLSHALYNHTHLFYSRHLDTLLLASLYGYCKVNKLNQITFREIISQYKRQAHAKQEVFRTVVLQQTDPGLVTQTTGDIIAFYNVVFVPAMKGFLLTTMQPASSGQAANGRDPSNKAAAAAARQHSGELPDAHAVQTSGAQSPVLTAVMHAAQQQQQQRGWGAAAPPVGSGSAYRALSLAGGSVAGVEGLALNDGGGSLSGGGGLGSSLSGLPSGGRIDPTAFGSSSSVPLRGPAGVGFGVGGYQPPAGLYHDDGVAPWGVDDSEGVAAAAPAHARSAVFGHHYYSKTAAMPMPASGAVPSRLSRLSRPSAAADIQLQLQQPALGSGLDVAGQLLNPKLRGALCHLGELAAAADLRQQQDQGIPVSAAAAAAEGMEFDDVPTVVAAAGNRHAAGTSSPSETASPPNSRGSAGTSSAGTDGRPNAQKDSAPTQQKQQQDPVSTGLASPAGLATLMRALDTTGGASVGAPQPAAAAAGDDGSIELQVPGGLRQPQQQE